MARRGLKSQCASTIGVTAPKRRRDSNWLNPCERNSRGQVQVSSVVQPHRSTEADRVDNRIRLEFMGSTQFDLGAHLRELTE
jgi:hypothetical protein